jgi:hypothetical protein
MKIGVPKEIKTNENRVGLVPASVRELTQNGHEVLIEASAGVGAGITDADFAAAGAQILATADDVFATADMIVKVKEPQKVERQKLRPGQILFTYLHLAPDPEQTEDLQKSGTTCIAYETVTAADGSLPLLTPMSEVAGRMAVQVGATSLEKFHGGRGILLGGVPGVAPAEVVVLGAGVAGSNATAMALGMGASVTVVDRSLPAQIRLNGQALIQAKGPETRAAWNTFQDHTLMLFRKPLAAGTPIQFPAEGHVKSTGEPPQGHDGYENLALIEVSLTCLEWLDVSGQDHERVVYRRSEGHWAGSWIAP